jgi:hypothetical protein
MAIYSTFFLCRPQDLLDGFPGWRLPLPKPVSRELVHPFTKQLTVIQTREPEWTDDDASESVDRPFKAISIQGRYEDYLEGRISPFIRAHPHWCAKGLTEIELDPLGQIHGLEPALDYALYSRPSSGAVLQQMNVELIATLASFDANEVMAAAKKWAEIMSGPDYTQSVTGKKLSDGWTMKDAMGILQPIIELAKQAGSENGVYLLIEA